MSTQSTFQALDFFVLRTPLLPADVFQQELTSAQGPLLERLAQLAQDPLIREAIAVSSLSLLDSLINLSPDSPPRKREQAAKGFLRYLLRMSTRPTPFGLFSGVTYGGYGSEYAFQLREAAGHKKRTRPDMEWMLRVVARLESDPDIVSQLQVTANTMAYEVGARTHLPYLTRCGQMRRAGVAPQMERTSVRTTPAVQQALAFAQTPVPYGELVDHLHRAYPDTSHEQINQFVRQLFEQELLISELRPPLLDVSPLTYVLKRLQEVRGAEELKGQLQDISALLTAYDDLPLGAGEGMYRRLVDKMKEVADGKHLLQVDLAVQTEALILPHTVKADVERMADVLWKLSNDAFGLPHMSQYRNDFLEKYGSAREVPLLELLDEDIGLGAPASYEYPRSRRQEERPNFHFQQRKKHLLSQWLMAVLLQGGQELVLTDERVAELAGEGTDTRYAPRSFEIYVSLATASKEAMEAGDYRLLTGSASGSYGAGKSIGRFVDFMEPELREQLHQVDELERAGCPGIVLAELVYLPGDGRAANVAVSYNNRQYEIVMGTTSSKEPERTIPLSDLVVGIDQTGFYLRSLRLGQEVIAVTGHMLNTTQTPNVYRFLRELTQERQRNIELFGWGELDSLPFLPRVRYERCVLSPARWKLSDQIAPFRSGMKEAEWMDAFQTYRAEWRVPRYVYLTQTDNRLLLDLEQEEHLGEIWRDYAKLRFGQAIVLTELGHEWGEFPESKQGRYQTEFVFPVVKSAAANKREGVRGKPHAVIRYAERLKLPGSEWLFLKWYGVQDRMEEFLSGPMRDFCRRAEQQKWADASFFMRYADPAPHIRLRFRGDPRKLQTELLPHLHGFAQHCMQEGMLSRMVIDTYDPEVERYGGPELIGLAEQWFCMDSGVVTHWIGLHEQGQLPIGKDMLAVVSVIDIMEQFGVPYEEQLASLNRIVNYKEHLELFRPQRALYIQLGDGRNGFAGLASHPAGQSLLPAFQARSGILRHYAVQVAERERREMGAIHRLDVMHSVIHLHLNRLYGIDREDEMRILTLVRHTLHSLGPIRRGRT